MNKMIGLVSTNAAQITFSPNPGLYPLALFGNVVVDFIDSSLQ